MHVGRTGLRRGRYSEEEFALLPPVGLEDTPPSILDVADIVGNELVSVSMAGLDGVSFAWDEGGHMMYLRTKDLAASNQDLREFLAWCPGGDGSYCGQRGTQ